MRWLAATVAGREVNQDAYWSSPDGRFACVADGGSRPDQHSELASATCCRVAASLYAPNAGDDLIETIARESNLALLRRVVAGERIGTTGLSLVHVSASGAVLAAALRDSPILHGRGGTLLRRVRPRRKYDYLAEPAEILTLDLTFASMDWRLRIPLEYHLPYADLSLTPANERLDLQDGDVIAICSDGVTDVVKDFEILRAIAPGELILLARERGSRDDATCVLAR